MQTRYGFLSSIVCCWVLLSARADEPVVKSFPIAKLEIKNHGPQRAEVGEVWEEGQDGSKLFLTRAGELMFLEAADVVKGSPTTEKFSPFSKSKAGELLKQELGAEFLSLETEHFVVVYNTSETYARWVGDLYEKLYKTFHKYWDRQLELNEPRLPMVALVFKSQDAYMQFAKPEVGDLAKDMIGYYHLQTNRIVSFDITGVQGLAQPGQRYSSREMLMQLFTQPHAERTVATVVHEAVHQIAYNCGMQVRFADNPKWVSEGMAMFFEVPDPKSNVLWGTVGKVNPYQLTQFRKYLANRPADSLTTLISDDERFSGPGEQVLAAYAESWALTYYLMKAQKKNYAAYLAEHAQLKPLAEPDPRQRIELFKKHFGSNFAKLDADFIKFIRVQKL